MYIVQCMFPHIILILYLRNQAYDELTRPRPDSNYWRHHNMQVDFDYGVDSIEMVIINSMAPMESFTAELGRGQSEFPIKNYIGQQARQAPAGKRPWQDGSSQEEEHSLNPETRCQGEKVCCFNWVLPSLCLHVSGKVPRKRSNNFASPEMRWLSLWRRQKRRSETPWGSFSNWNDWLWNQPICLWIW